MTTGVAHFSVRAYTVLAMSATSNQPLRTVAIRPTVWIPLPDGRRLHARIWMPEDAERHPVPAVLHYHPYALSWFTLGGDERQLGALAAQGIAGVRVDIAGSGESDGLLHDEYLQTELDDAVAVIAWIAEQPWCSDSVGMFGSSWSGFNALQVAALRPPALKAIISSDSTDDRYADDVHYMGGCVIGSEISVWGAWCHAFSVAAPDPEIVGERWREQWRERLEQVEPVIGTWLSHQRRDAYWKHGSVCQNHAAIECPVLMTGGWSDGYRSAILRMLDALPERTWALAGPWSHGWPSSAAPGPNVDFEAITTRWWRHWLCGHDEGIEQDPRLIAYIEDSRRPREHLMERPGRWLAFDRWSAAEAPTVVLEGTASSAAGTVPTVHWRADTGLAAGIWCPTGGTGDLPSDQAPDDALAACLDWELTEPLDVLGIARVRLRVEVDAERALVAARLCDVAPDGSSTLIADGQLNLAHRDGHDVPAPVPVGVPIDVTFPLRAVGYRVPAGHRLRLAVAPAAWPMAWPSPTPTRLRVLADDAAVAVSTAAAGVPAEDPLLAPPPPPPGAEPKRSASFGDRGRSVTRNFEDGTITMRFVQDDERSWDDGLVASERERTEWVSHPDGPLATRAKTTVVMERRRGDWHAKLEHVAAVHADADAFHVRVTVRATAGDETVHDRTHEWTIARDLV